jgi:organic radical activating enzyme
MRFTPFVDALAEDVKTQLIAFVGLEEPRRGPIALKPLATRNSSDPKVWHAEVTVRDADGDFVLDLFPASAARESWFRTPHFACGYRSTAQNNPFSRPATAAWLNALRARLTSAEATTSAALLERLNQYQPYLAVKDETFRYAIPTAEGVSGVLWLGTRCNQNCHVCWQGRDWPEPPKDQFFLWLDELIASGVRRLIISGGEPTLQPYLPELLQRASMAGVRLVLETNALRLADAELRRSLRESGLDELLVSLHSADAAASDTTTRTPGSHAQTVAGIEACLADGFVVELHCVVDKQNHTALDDYARFVVDRFVRRVSGPGRLTSVSFSHPTRYSDLELHRRLMAPIDEVRPSLARAVEILNEAGVRAAFLGMSGFPVCVVPQPLASLELLPKEDVPDSSRGARVFADVCGTCDLRPRCFGVQSSYLDAHGHRGLTPVRLPPGVTLPRPHETRS